LRVGREKIMEKKETMMVHVSTRLEDMEGACRATGISSSGRIGDLIGLSVVSDSEVPEKEVLHAERFVDRAPLEIYDTLLDEGKYLCSVRR
jgi:hypothetical protein